MKEHVLRFMKRELEPLCGKISSLHQCELHCEKVIQKLNQGAGVVDITDLLWLSCSSQLVQMFKNSSSISAGL